MYILAIKFDLNWFLTIPGMLITGGVLLLLIALIIFIATAGSSKKNKKGVNELVEGSEDKKIPMGDNMVAPAMDANGIGINQPITEMPNNTIMPNIPNINDNNLNNPVAPAPVDLPQPSVTVVGDNQFSPGEVNSVYPPVQDMTQENSASAPISEPPVNPVPTEPVSTEQPPVSIYGGVSPTIPEDVVNSIPNQGERPIYGGNNPLDATQAIPTITPAEPVVANNPNDDATTPVNDASDAIDNITNIQPISVPTADNVDDTPKDIPEPNDNNIKNESVAAPINDNTVNADDNAVDIPSINPVQADIKEEDVPAVENVVPPKEDEAGETPQEDTTKTQKDDIEILDF